MKMIKKIGAVFDTNQFISALVYRSKTILEAFAVAYGEGVVFYSPELIQEIQTKLIQKFHFDESDLEELEEFVRQGQLVIPTKTISMARDPKDNFLLELAEESQADFLITGDKDLLILEKWVKTKICNAKDFILKI